MYVQLVTRLLLKYIITFENNWQMSSTYKQIDDYIKDTSRFHNSVENTSSGRNMPTQQVKYCIQIYNSIQI